MADARTTASGRQTTDAEQLPAPTDRRMLAWFVGYLRPHWLTVTVGVVATILNSATDLAGPTLFGKGIIDKVILGGQMSQFAKYLGALLGIYVANAVLSGVRNNLMFRLGQRFIHDVRVEASEHLQRMSLSFFDRHRTGDIMSRLSNDVNAVEDIITQGTDVLLTDGLRVLGAIGVLMYLNARLALFALIPLPLFVIGIVVFSLWVRPYYRLLRDQLGDINAELQENISGVRVVRAFSREEYEQAKIEERSRRFLDSNVRVIWLWTTFSPAVTLLVSCSIVVVIALGAPQASGGQVTFAGATTGDIVVFVTLLQLLYTRLNSLSKVYNIYNKGLAAMGRVFALFDAEPSVQDAPDAIELSRVEGRVEFRDVSFRYADGELVLRSVNVVAEPGEVVAIVGRSGAGKTSMVNLIPRFYDPLEGQVLVDGVDVRGITQKSLRGQMAMVLQETFLFSGTVRDNIRYGRLDATDEEIRAAARAANADDFIERLPDGYDSEVGERGAHLSGGQAQRISIARAVLADPRILILDEATSLVDAEAEERIQAALENLSRGRTTFVIAHRLSTVRNADKIVVIDDGRVVQQADHETLIRDGGLYAELCARQFLLDAPSLGEGLQQGPSVGGL